MESLFHTKPVSKRASIVKTAFAKPGKESFFAKANPDSSATDDVVEVVVDLLQLLKQISPKTLNMYKNRFIFRIFELFICVYCFFFVLLHPQK